MTQKIMEPHPAYFSLRKLAEINRLAVGFKSKIRIRKGAIAADAKSFIETIALLDAKGKFVEITVDGEDSPAAVKALRLALSSNDDPPAGLSGGKK